MNRRSNSLEERRTCRRPALRVSPAVVFARISFVIAASVVSTNSAAQPTPEQVREGVRTVGLHALLSAMARQEAVNLPRLANSETQIVTVQHIAQGGKHLVYYSMRLLAVDVRGARKEDIEHAKRVSRNLDTNELCFSPTHGTLINEYGVIYRYAYHDEAMRFIHGYDIDRASCVKAGVK